MAKKIHLSIRCEESLKEALATIAGFEAVSVTTVIERFLSDSVDRYVAKNKDAPKKFEQKWKKLQKKPAAS